MVIYFIVQLLQFIQVSDLDNRLLFTNFNQVLRKNIAFFLDPHFQ